LDVLGSSFDERSTRARSTTNGLERRPQHAERRTQNWLVVRYLRMLSNSVVAAVLATCYVLALVLLLNPRLPLAPADLVPLAGTIGLYYAVHLTAIFYVVLVVRQLLARELFSPAWVSVAVLSWFGAGAAAAGAALMWANLRTFTLVLEPEARRAIVSGAIVLASAASLFAIIGLAGRRAGSRVVWAAALMTIAAASIAAPVALRGRGLLPPLDARPFDAGLEGAPAPVEPRVTIIAIDAGSLELVTTAAAEGRLPNFGRILDTGAVMHLATLHPTSAEAVWAAVATGKLPQKNGVRSATVYIPEGGGDPIRLLPDFCFANGVVRFGLLTEQAHSSATVRTRTLWGILSGSGITSGVVNWPLTYPASPVRGYLVSDRYAQLALTLAGLEDEQLTYPPDLEPEFLPVVQAARSEPAAATPGRDAMAEIPERYREAGRIDRVYDRLAQALAESRDPQVRITRYQSLDPIGHYFLRYAAPSSFGNVTEEERRRFGPVLEGHYRLIDDAIGRAISTLGPDDLLLVISAYGMEPLGFGKRLLEQIIGDPELSGTHEAAPDGFLMAYGSAVAKSRQLRRASVVDVTPTVLYFLGLPIGRDMDGYARTDLFRPAFFAERPITFIPTYDR
jgi:predicted AlkP superfamily phosphohydrolase/phosphomutase